MKRKEKYITQLPAHVWIGIVAALMAFFYKIEKGTSMGNSLSPFLANLFMSNLEWNLQKGKKIFQKFGSWYFRYNEEKQPEQNVK